jgi:hypothetical protein
MMEWNGGMEWNAERNGILDACAHNAPSYLYDNIIEALALFVVDAMLYAYFTHHTSYWDLN